jgi:release factor glutamine methyltransferase
MGIKIQTIKDIRFYLAGELEGIYPESEIRSLSNIIIRNVLGITSLHQVYITDQRVSSRQASEITGICQELKTGKPIQYIFGETVFYDCKIKLNSSTLIPRPETEELVDLIIRENRGYTGNIIDYGTGSGCIAIALARNLTGSAITATDISGEALNAAEHNASINNVKINFLKEDILSPEKVSLEKAGIIVSNPPYVRNSEKKLMDKNVLDFEPHRALFVDDSDPLIFYKAILKKSTRIIEPAGKIYFEINEEYGRSMVHLLESFNYTDVLLTKDINGKDRIIRGIRYGG